MLDKSKIIFCFLTISILQTAVSQVNVEALDTYLGSLYENGKFNGNVLLADRGQIVYQKSFGIANQTTKEKLSLNHVFETASVSKQFTAMAILILKDKKKLSLDDEISKYIPEMKNYPPINIKNLLHHTSGLPDYLKLDSLFDKSKMNNNKDVIDIYAKYTPNLDFLPNTQHLYSNTNYVLLASIIEKVSKQSFGDFLQNEIFIPLEMKNTLVYRRRYQPRQVENYAYGYIFSTSENRYILPDSLAQYRKVIYFDGIQGDGVVNSTLGDLLKWDRALYTDKLATKESLAEMFTPTPLSNDSYYQYGYGWRIHKNSQFGKVVSHSGGWPGYNAYIERHLDNDKTIIILSNTNTSFQPYNVLQRTLYHLPIPYEIIIDKNVLKRYIGEYELSPNAIFTISLSEKGELMAKQPGSIAIPIHPETENRFFFEEFQNVYIEFIKDENGTVTKFDIINNDGKTEVIKK